MGTLPPLRVAGCDLGKSTLSVVIGAVNAAGEIALESAETIAHEGQPMEAFARWYARRAAHTCAALGVTGLHGTELIAPAISGLPEEACLEAALAAERGLHGPLNLVSIGARGYAVLVRDEGGRVRYVENDKCSSGTGETMVKIAGRFGLSIEEADRLALTAPSAIPITARCSVFAKSEMTHFGNQGRPADALFRGYFGSVANYVGALLARVRVDGPVVAIGGGARIQSLVRALGEALGATVSVHPQAQHLEAIGAALLAAESHRGGAQSPLPVEPGGIIEQQPTRVTSLPAASDAAARVTRLPPPEIAPGADREPSILGLDLGSTGSKAVLTSIATGEPVLSVYDRTRGNPVGAAQRLIAAVLERTTPDVRAIGVTGSGREAVATVLRAAVPEELADRVLVLTEIVAHATAAITCDPEGGRSLSVVEIGGQDAKFIQIAGGRIVESDMNKACSAGTGSFLEEQAVFYGVHDIERFTELARHATRPPALGQMCTVFVADAAAEAHRAGYSIGDLFGGFQYSVIHNYINRVMGQRTFADRIFFQGKPATGPSLAWTLAAVTGREVIVPPDPGAMGAWGIGLCARTDLDTEQLTLGPALDLRPVLDAEVTARREFQCRDKRCDTLCSIEKATVVVAGAPHTVLSGGACPKYEVSRTRGAKMPLGAPAPFAARRELLAPFMAPRDRTRVVGLPYVGALVGALPWLVAFLDHLGFGVRVLAPDARSLGRGEERCYAFDACAPVKVAHGVLDADVSSVFFPKLLSLPDRDGPGGGTCPMEQALPDTIRQALKARGRDVEIIGPPLSLGAHRTSLSHLRELAEAARQLGVPAERAGAAALHADQVQERVDRELARVGREALAWGRQSGVPIVAVCGSLHVVCDDTINGQIPRLLTENGALAIPMDMIPLDDNTPPVARVPWADSRRALRVAVAARQRGDVYPLLLTSFGCGPSSFVEQAFTDVLAGYPHTVLESDGHGGTAGYVTRVQAFLHTARRHDGTRDRIPPQRLERLERTRTRPMDDPIGDSRVLVLAIGDRFSDMIAACYRSFGVDAQSAGATSEEVLAAGRQDCSGKECLPYQLVWGAFRKRLAAEDADGRHTALLQATGEGSCRNCLFALKDEINLERAGWSDVASPRLLGDEPAGGWAFTMRVYTATMIWDLLFQLASYYRPLERRPGAMDDLQRQYLDEAEAMVSRRAPDGGVRRAAEAYTLVREAGDLVERAAREACRLVRPAADERTVLVCGDIYLRVDEFASGSLIRRLNALGLRVLAEPVGPLTEYLVHERSPEILGFPTGRLDSAVRGRVMAHIRRALHARVRPLHPWLPQVDIPAAQAAASDLIGRHPVGEAPATVGTVLHNWHERTCDGAVVVSPWGCGPALISESLLKHCEDIPLLFVYGDGSPIDERRLRGFAFRLARTPPRCQ